MRRASGCCYGELPTARASVSDNGDDAGSGVAPSSKVTGGGAAGAGAGTDASSPSGSGPTLSNLNLSSSSAEISLVQQTPPAVNAPQSFSEGF